MGLVERQWAVSDAHRFLSALDIDRRVVSGKVTLMIPLLLVITAESRKLGSSRYSLKLHARHFMLV